jgi:hypothetical protein
MKILKLILPLLAIVATVALSVVAQTVTNNHLRALQGVWVLPKPAPPFTTARVTVQSTNMRVYFEREGFSKPFTYHATIFDVSTNRIRFHREGKGLVYVIRDGKLGLEDISKDYDSIGEILLEKQK